jgi:hypothetical protein
MVLARLLSGHVPPDRSVRVPSMDKVDKSAKRHQASHTQSQTKPRSQRPPNTEGLTPEGGGPSHHESHTPRLALVG